MQRLRTFECSLSVDAGVRCTRVKADAVSYKLGKDAQDKDPLKVLRSVLYKKMVVWWLPELLTTTSLRHLAATV